MKTTIVIATRNRVDKLRNTLKSIPYLPGLDTIVAVDGEGRTGPVVRNEFPHIKLVEYAEHLGSVTVRNRTIEVHCERSNVLYFVDDAVFLPGAVERALEDFEQFFPDTDGVLGLSQTGDQSFHPTGVAIIGNAFLDRYKNRNPFFPGYWHFACQEIHWLAEKLDKFKLSEAAITHFHPSFDRKLVDKTHVEARQRAQYDRDVRRERESKGHIWGDHGTA